MARRSSRWCRTRRPLPRRGRRARAPCCRAASRRKRSSPRWSRWRTGWPCWTIELPLARPAPSAAELTARELDVLRLLAEGLPNKAIAQRLAISEHTVKFHLNAILGKLGAQSRTEAVVQAIRRGLIGV